MLHSRQSLTHSVSEITCSHTRWFNEKDIVSGAAIANRDYHPSYGDRLGCFRNVLPIRSDSSSNPVYSDMLKQVKGKIIQSWYVYILLLLK